MLGFTAGSPWAKSQSGKDLSAYQNILGQQQNYLNPLIAQQQSAYNAGPSPMIGQWQQNTLGNLAQNTRQAYGSSLVNAAKGGSLNSTSFANAMAALGQGQAQGVGQTTLQAQQMGSQQQQQALQNLLQSLGLLGNVGQGYLQAGQQWQQQAQQADPWSAIGALLGNVGYNGQNGKFSWGPTLMAAGA